jgi:hypothetical protein
MNLEEDDARIFSKDRWPIPLRDTAFLNVNAGGLHFGSSFPTFIIDPKPVKFDLSRCNAEALHLNDPLLIQTLTDQLIKARNLSEDVLLKHGWYVYAEGETQNYPFGLMKAIKNKALGVEEQLS